jgi:hypothetical protein
LSEPQLGFVGSGPSSRIPLDRSVENPIMPTVSGHLSPYCPDWGGIRFCELQPPAPRTARYEPPFVGEPGKVSNVPYVAAWPSAAT